MNRNERQQLFGLNVWDFKDFLGYKNLIGKNILTHVCHLNIFALRSDQFSDSRAMDNVSLPSFLRDEAESAFKSI